MTTYCWDEDLSGTRQPFGGTIPNKLMEDLKDKLGTSFVGDGTTDDTAAIRAEALALSAAGGGDTLANDCGLIGARLRFS